MLSSALSRPSDWLMACNVRVAAPQVQCGADSALMAVTDPVPVAQEPSGFEVAVRARSWDWLLELRRRLKVDIQLVDDRQTPLLPFASGPAPSSVWTLGTARAGRSLRGDEFTADASSAGCHLARPADHLSGAHRGAEYVGRARSGSHAAAMGRIQRRPAHNWSSWGRGYPPPSRPTCSARLRFTPAA